MLTDKMNFVATSIEYIIRHTFPSAYLMDLLTEEIEVKDIVTQVLFECCKFAYDQTAEKKSLRSHLKSNNLTEDYQRMTIKRSVDKINKYRQSYYEAIKYQTEMEISELLPLKMDSIEQKLSGYQYNDFQFWEIMNVHDMELVDAIVTGRIANKNFKIQTFKDYAEDYDKAVNKFMTIFDNTRSAEDVFFTSFEFFVLAWKYAFDFYYEIALEMESSKITYIPDLERRCSLFCGIVGLISPYDFSVPRLGGNVIHTNSRMVILRRKFVKPFVNVQDENGFNVVEQRYTKALTIVSSLLLRMTLEGKNIREWFASYTTMDDWASVMGEYNVFSAFIPDKCWTTKRIRYVKEIYRKLYEANSAVKNPENRS